MVNSGDAKKGGLKKIRARRARVVKHKEDSLMEGFLEVANLGLQDNRVDGFEREHGR